ncbi:methyl-accepting chemotaxis protein [Methyloversatilis thermotolerans]|uniref:methyl-accepting chemotaxis protein n=1 Tax=Methyloversatilis thermotolerans TaxID=1346290 RepID=UPI0003645D49|nr:methyl-accepting chemotaxis protein [Methyloversatilis thermotolerans]
MLKQLSVSKAFALFGVLSALICCTAAGLLSVFVSPGPWAALGLSLVLVIASSLAGVAIGRFYGRRAETIVHGLNALAKGRLDHRIALDGRDDFAWLAYEYNSARKAVKTLVERLQVLAGTLSGAAGELSGSSATARENVARQLDSIRAVAGAIDQMSGNVAEVESISVEANKLAEAAGEASRAGKTTLQASLNSVHGASEKMSASLKVIEQLVEDSRAINRINDLIKELSDQTNLLALNAAIEAARAGEQGRGFAVVADEVRKLAQRSQASANDISELVVRIRDDAEQTIALVRSSDEEVGVASNNTATAVAEFEDIMKQLDELLSKSATISSSLGAQSAAVGEIVRNTDLLFSLSEQTSAGADDTARQGVEVAGSAKSLEEAVQAFHI